MLWFVTLPVILVFVFPFLGIIKLLDMIDGDEK